MLPSSGRILNTNKYDAVKHWHRKKNEGTSPSIAPKVLHAP